ncbi:MAG: hypothetical protein IPL27_27760 [Lewinellaceae bacterium]|nr:hypothetical protein [Lewinellaceae bacterium]
MPLPTDGIAIQKAGSVLSGGAGPYMRHPEVKLASVVGRYCAMDRDKRWEQVKLAYDLLVRGEGGIAQMC